MALSLSTEPIIAATRGYPKVVENGEIDRVGEETAAQSTFARPPAPSIYASFLPSNSRHPQTTNEEAALTLSLAVCSKTDL